MMCLFYKVSLMVLIFSNHIHPAAEEKHVIARERSDYRRRFFPAMFAAHFTLSSYCVSKDPVCSSSMGLCTYVLAEELISRDLMDVDKETRQLTSTDIRKLAARIRSRSRDAIGENMLSKALINHFSNSFSMPSNAVYLIRNHAWYNPGRIATPEELQEISSKTFCKLTNSRISLKIQPKQRLRADGQFIIETDASIEITHNTILSLTVAKIKNYITAPTLITE